jgi:hypothetical protein
MTMTARGLRNNNPGNIRRGGCKKYVGQIGDDGTFIKFSNIVYGLRALIKILNTYYYVHNLRTVYDIISRWAPDNENNTSAYARRVAAITGLGMNRKFDWSETNVEPIVDAICQVECGCKVNPQFIDTAWKFFHTGSL